MIIDYNFILTELVNNDALDHYTLDECISIEAEKNADFVRKAMNHAAIEILMLIKSRINPVDEKTVMEFVEQLKSEKILIPYIPNHK